MGASWRAAGAAVSAGAKDAGSGVDGFAGFSIGRVSTASEGGGATGYR